MKRIILLAFVYCMIFVLGLEALLSAYYYVSAGKVFYGRTIAKHDMSPTYSVAQAVFHPYFGYTLRPGREGEFNENRRWRANNFGFQHLIGEGGLYCCDYPYTPKSGELIVGILGGSVGSGYALYAALNDGLAKALRQAPGWDKKAIRIVNLAQPGFKQPQQLFAYLYFLSIGQTFDLLINIDGFNEVVTTWRNWDSGVEPNYPADTLWGAWGRQLEQYNVPYAERGFLLSNYHRISAQGMRGDIRDCSFAVCFYVTLVMASYHDWRSEAEKNKTLDQLTKRSYFPTNTFSPLPADFDIYRYTADVWRKTSVAITQIARANRTPYLHLLQPNQWFLPAGPYDPIDLDHPYEWVIKPINRGYTMLLADAAELRKAGTNFVDLTKLFWGRAAHEVYADDCCHYTESGYDMIFEATGVALADALRLHDVNGFKSEGVANRETTP